MRSCSGLRAIACSLDVSCVSFAFFFPLYGRSDVLPSVTPRCSVQQLGCVRGEAGQLSNGQICAGRLPNPPGLSLLPGGTVLLPSTRHLTLHPMPSCRLGLQQAPAELLWHNLAALKAATASASFDPYVLGMFSAGQNWKYGKLLVLKRRQ